MGLRIIWYEEASSTVQRYVYEPKDSEDLERKLEELRGKDSLRGLSVEGQNAESPRPEEKSRAQG